MIDSEKVSEFIETSNFDDVILYDHFSKKPLTDDVDTYKDWVIVKHIINDYGRFGINIELYITYGKR